MSDLDDFKDEARDTAHRAYLDITADTRSFHPDRKPKPTGTLMVNEANDGLLHEPLPGDVADRLTALISECLTPQQSAVIDDLLEPYGLKAGLVTITGYERAFEVEADES